MNWRLSVLVVAVVALLGVAIMSTQVPPATVFKTLFEGSLGSASRISDSLKEITPLLIAGIAVFVALQAGLFNIGAEGQLILGALSGVLVAQRIPGAAGWVLGSLAGMVVGGLWALPAALIKVYRNGHEVISTIMLNNIALLLGSAMVNGPFKGKLSGAPTTDPLDKGSMIPALMIGNLRISLAIFVGLALAIGIAIWIRKSVRGFELRAVGANLRAAEFAGVEAKRVMIRAMVASGALAGLAGSFQSLGYEGRFYPDFSPGYGFDALGVALLAGTNPWGILPAAAVFGILNKGSSALTIEGVPKGITGILLGLLIIVFAAVRYRESKASGS
ncbi:MAG: ABC transporter permease [Armatimonadetes bacterium]|nr:ABC transporter permease [Armatimonadota bacterium]